MMTQSEVRQMFVRANPGVRRRGRGGYWYRCARCGKWCGRPGREGAYIREDEKMEVDHIIPWSKSQFDALSNLQPLCKPCNRSKSNNQSSFETIRGTTRAIVAGDGLSLLGGVLKTKLEHSVGYYRKRR